ncbi:MAG: L-fucokinase [Candidatus Poribacteria bacterium]|nr:L-fucokinase [Candidatus Poribacteria bacterium]
MIWQNLVLTATNDAQAQVFELQLDRLRRAEIIGLGTRTQVVADPAGKRIGSGGATINALAGCFPNGIDPTQKTLILHAGGDCQRIPHQSLLGKLFAPLLPPDFSVFESIYRVLNGIGQQLESGIVIASGDTPIRQPTEPQLPNQTFDVLGIGYWGSIALGTQHGVYQFEGGTVERVWQKSDPKTLQQISNHQGQVAVDTGILIFQDRGVEAWQKWINQASTDDQYLDLYGQVLPLLADDPEIDFRVWMPENLQFFHTGTTRQYFDLIGNSANKVEFIVPLQNEPTSWVKIEYATGENPKLAGDEATIFGQPIGQWLAKHQLSPDLIWVDSAGNSLSSQNRSLWTARLFPVLTGVAEVSDAQTADDEPPNWLTNPDSAWEATPRMSMAEAIAESDREKAFLLDQQTQAKILAQEILTQIELEQDRDFRPFLNQILTPEGYQTITRILTTGLERIESPLQRARLYKVVADLAGKMGDRDIQTQSWEQAFQAVSQSVEQSIVTQSATSGYTHSTNRSVTIQLPVRIDLAGGWTDTPPYSLERGGAVVNMGLLLNGTYPIQVQARWLSERVIRFRSIDQQQQIEIGDFAQLYHPPQLGDPIALPHATLLAGKILDYLQSPETGGLEIITSCNVPMGSGLGTSSILAAGLVIATWKLLDVQWTEEQLFNQVLYVEQILGSGGGWQDQVGGVVGGIKLTTTAAGIPQRFSVQPIELNSQSQKSLHEQLVLAYTGEQRVAKNILELVVADWLSRRSNLVQTLTHLRSDAYTMSKALEAGDLAQFGQLLTQYFEGKKVLNDGTTNATIDQLIDSVRHLCLGWGIAGAGGGGFLVFLAQDVNARRLIEQHLQSTPATIYNWEMASGYVTQS